MKKRIFSVLTAFFMMSAMLVGCASDRKKDDSEDERICIVCTTFPVYDWINNVIGAENDSFSVTLLGGGADLHSYRPTAQDIVDIKTSDLFVYIGGASDSWTSEAAADGLGASLCLFDVLRDDLKMEGTACGHEGEGHDEHDHDHSGEGAYDEHVWLSLRLARKAVAAISEQICELDFENAELYSKNAQKYIEELKNVDEEYENAISDYPERFVVFADRFPFLYLTEDYGIECCAAFPGCSTDIDASFETVAHLSEEVARHKKRCVLVLENSKQSIAETVFKSAGIDGETVVVNSCQSISMNEIENGASYIEIMKSNLKSLEKALGSDMTKKE